MLSRALTDAPDQLCRRRRLPTVLYIPGTCFVGASPSQRCHFTQQTPSMDIKIRETEEVMPDPDLPILFPDHIGPSAKVMRGNVRLHLIPSQGPEAQLGVKSFRHDARFKKAG